ncbi:hypothetical protein [uncultured Methanosphaera sp.]|uniref:hypothetical protein n=1 Tax=uncultured Methanosphaera sp. TaxID=262501 RepID=UPI0025968872|nr:hypothetical protein [uncultured Methanosphaera sp.]
MEHYEDIKLINQNYENIAAIGSNMDKVLEIPTWLDKINDLGKEKINDINTLTDASLKSIKDLVKTQLDESLAEIQKEAGKAAFSYRYLNKDPLPFEEISISYITPNVNIKVGDHVVTPKGDIYEIVELVNNEVIKVGTLVTSIKGPKGDIGLPGTGLELQGVYSSLEEFINAGLVGKPGDAYQIYDDKSGFQTIMVWNDNTKEWQDAGAIQGMPGMSANEILMDPDPEKWFLQIYGQSTGDIIGSLELKGGVTLSPDPTTTFENTMKFFEEL